jgi:transcriptional regulator of acetoin/glycerol metabolism
MSASASWAVMRRARLDWILAAVKAAHWNQQAAAARLGIHRNTVSRVLRAAGISVRRRRGRKYRRLS